MNEWLQIAKNVNKVFGPRLSHFRIESNGKNSIVNIEDSGLSLLLGRNGSGKTQLIEAIKNWSDSTENPVRAFPVFRLPTSTDISDWRNYVNQLQETYFVKEEVQTTLSMPGEEVNEESFNYLLIMDQVLKGASIPMLESLAQALEYSERIVHAELGNMDDEDVLHYFKLSESAIKDWRWRRSQGRDSWDDQQPMGWLEDSDIRSYACDYLLQHLAQAPKNTDIAHSLDQFNDVVPGWGRWFDDQSLASLVGPATEEFFECMSLVEMESSTSFRLISRPREDGDFAAFEHEIQNFIKLAQDEFPSERYPRQFEDSTQVFFPGKLFIPSNDPNERATPLLYTKKQEIEGLPYIVDITPLHDIGSFIQRIKKNIYRLVKVEPKAESRDSFTVQLTGLEKLDLISDSVSRLLESTELSISAVRISPVKINPLSGLNSYWPQMEKPLPTEPGYNFLNLVLDDELVDSFPIPDIHVFDQNRNEWTELQDASLGQQHVVGVLLQLAVLNELSRDSSQSVVVMADEIDSRLHWTASTALMSAISQYIESMDDGHGIVSTHSIPSLGRPELAGCATIFAERELSTFTYSSGRDLDIEQFSTLLGVDPLDSIRLAKLVLLVEGQHDEDVIRLIVLNLVPDPSRVVIVNARGIYAWAGLMTNLLRHSEIPVLLIHDKRDEALENEWKSFVRRYNNGEGYESWNKSPFDKMHQELNNKTKRQTGDDELEKLLLVIKDAVYHGDRTLANRMSIFGLEANDIVDLLPIGDFFKREAPRPRTWDEAWEKYPTGKKMKEAAGITIPSVVNSATKSATNPHAELRRLAKTITRLLGQS
jgi:hypothetical protein